MYCYYILLLLSTYTTTLLTVHLKIESDLLCLPLTVFLSSIGVSCDTYICIYIYIHTHVHTCLSLVYIYTYTYVVYVPYDIS